ncbi:MAG: NAD(P)-binding domain-containing protein [Bacteroidales bacterium]|nr:NAD(P)-binding domain-containing protein [Bacteroidales bacterium]MCF8457919.1 NAD(P)-binding domain-containing protein [Bacteroidales bacterium]
MKTKTLGFIGGGRITKIFLHAFEMQKTELNSIVVCDTNMAILEDLKRQFPKIQITDSCAITAQQEIVFIALHPPVIMETLELLKDSVSENTLVISLAPKITIEKIAQKLVTKNIARMIPNATTFINRGYNPICFSSGFSNEDKQFLLEMFSPFGDTFEVAENKLEGYAMVSAMLPTYFWFQWNELIKLGTLMDLTEQESIASVHKSLVASVDLMFQSKLSYDQLVDLIPVKPIAEHESQITEIFHSKLLGLYQKIKP